MFHFVCCFDECEGLMGQLERAIAAPFADPTPSAPRHPRQHTPAYHKIMRPRLCVKNHIAGQAGGQSGTSFGL